MKYADAAYKVLQQAARPLHYSEITRRAINAGFITPGGATPEATMGSRLYLETKKEDSRFQRVGRGLFSLVDRARTSEISERVEAINRKTRGQLRKLLAVMSPERFEALIGELLIAIGFEEDSVNVTQYSSDGGIDVRGILNAGGIAQVNAAVQVKRWKKNVQARTVRNVRGSLTTQEQGIIITTSDFSRGARQEANAIGKTPVSLVNGAELMELLIRHSIGVNKEQHTVYSMDEEWWGESVTIEPVLPAPEPVRPTIHYPLTVRAMNNPAVTAQMLDQNGHMRFGDKEYTSPSTAGKDASGWKSSNGWTYWRYQDPETQEWRPINDLRPQLSS